MNCTNKYYTNIINNVKKINLILELKEMSYAGNVGIAEMMKFYDVASKEEIELFEALMAKDDIKNAWELVQKVTNTRLHGL